MVRGHCSQAERTAVMHSVLGVAGIKNRDECDCLELTWILPSDALPNYRTSWLWTIAGYTGGVLVIFWYLWSFRVDINDSWHEC